MIINIQSERDPQGRSVGGTRGYDPRGNDTIYMRLLYTIWLGLKE